MLFRSVALQAPLSMGFPRQEYWSGLPFSSLSDLPNSGIEPGSLQADSLLVGLPGLGVPALETVEQAWEGPLEKEMATHSSIPAWEIPWTEEPGGPQSMGSQRVRAY